MEAIYCIVPSVDPERQGGSSRDWRNLQSEERCDLYMPPDFIRVIKQKEE
jgi:hypothetical protein